MFTSPGADLDLYLDLTRNGEPIDSETVPELRGIWYAGANLITDPLPLSQIGTGHYYVSVTMDPATDYGCYQAEIVFTRLGRERRELQPFDVVPDPSSTQALLSAILASSEANLPANTQMEFAKALVDDLVTNAAAGRYREVRFAHKRSSDADFASPVAQGVRTLFYERLGDSEPSRAGVS